MEKRKKSAQVRKARAARRYTNRGGREQLTAVKPESGDGAGDREVATPVRGVANPINRWNRGGYLNYKPEGVFKKNF